MNRKGLTGELIAELFGTFVLILLGDGVVAEVGLAPRLASQGYDWNTIVWGWGLAVVMAVYVAGGVTGAHINPAVTFAMAVKRDFPWGKVIPYWIAQIAGAFLGAFAVYLVYYAGLKEAGMPNVWCTGPGAVFGDPFWGATLDGVANGGGYPWWNTMVSEFFGTAMLLLGIVAIVDNKNVGPTANLWPFMVGMLVLAIGLSLGGPSGYAINPARDFGPRLFGLIAGTKDLFTSDFYWLLSPIIAPLIGGVAGVFAYDYLIVPYLPKKEE